MRWRRRKTRARPWLWLVRLIGVIVPRRLRAGWRQEWEAELQYRETLLARWDHLNWRTRLDLLWHSAGAFADALWLQPKRWEDEMIQDIRFGVRMLLKQKVFALIAILTLALGIGANTAIFSVANAILLRPLPIKDADRIVHVHRPFAPRWEAFSYPHYLELRKRSGAVVDLFASSHAELALGASAAGSKAAPDNESEQLRGLLVTGTYFSALGGNAALGRTLTPEDDQVEGAHPVVVLSYGFWQRRFGAAPDIVGQTILLNGLAFTVIGVAEANFTGADLGKPNFWAPALMRDQLKLQDNLLGQLDGGWLRVKGRLKPGVSLRQAEAALAMALSQLAQDSPSFAPGPPRQGEIVTTIELIDPEKRPSFAPDPRTQIKLYPVTLAAMDGPEMIRTITTIMSVALGAVMLVMLIACLNVAGLMLARLASRQREIAMRLSLGASRLRLLRQLFTESLLLAVAGGLAGVLLSRWMAEALSFVANNPPGGIPLDWRVMAYTLGISAFTAVVVGLLPARQTTRFDLIPALKQEGTGFNLRAPRFPLRSALVIGQIALSLVLLLGGGLFARTLLSVVKIDPGFETKNLSVVQFRFGPGSHGYDETRTAQFQRELQDRLLASPPVKDAVWVGHVPLMDEPFDRDPTEAIYWTDDGSASIVKVNGVSGIRARAPGNDAASNVVAPNYFAALGVPLLYGRTFTEQDTRDNKAVVIVNEALGRRHWPGESPIGKSLLMRDRKWEIVGVAKNTRTRLFHAANEPYFYLPVPPDGRFGLKLLVRSDPADPAALAATLRTTVQSLDPKLKIDVLQFGEILKRPLKPLLLVVSLASLAGLLALALAVMGLYGVTAFVVVQRTREIGVRMALGARAADVVRLVLRQGLRLVIIGVAIGLSLSVVATRVLAAALFGVSPTDPITFVVITLLLGAVAMLACWVPARRATKVDPLVALRHE
jgi:predicted permease